MAGMRNIFSSYLDERPATRGWHSPPCVKCVGVIGRGTHGALYTVKADESSSPPPMNLCFFMTAGRPTVKVAGQAFSKGVGVRWSRFADRLEVEKTITPARPHHGTGNALLHEDCGCHELLHNHGLCGSRVQCTTNRKRT
jgi:hypothetical protein